MPTECSAALFEFARVEGRSVVGAFDGGKITSVAGALLLEATDRAVRLIDRFATAGRRSWSRNNTSAPKLTRRVTALSGRGDGTSPFSRLFNFQGKGAVGGATCVFPSHLSQRRRAGLPMLQIPA
jgi:hypothetical protein